MGRQRSRAGSMPVRLTIRLAGLRQPSIKSVSTSCGSVAGRSSIHDRLNIRHAGFRWTSDGSVSAPCGSVAGRSSIQDRLNIRHAGFCQTSDRCVSTPCGSITTQGHRFRQTGPSRAGCGNFPAESRPNRCAALFPFHAGPWLIFRSANRRTPAGQGHIVRIGGCGGLPLEAYLRSLEVQSSRAAFPPG